MSVQVLRYYIGFNLVQGIGPARLRMLLDAFGDVEAAWHAPADALRRAGRCTTCWRPDRGWTSTRR